MSNLAKLHKAKISGERLQDHWSSGFGKHTHKIPTLYAVVYANVTTNKALLHSAVSLTEGEVARVKLV